MMRSPESTNKKDAALDIAVPSALSLITAADSYSSEEP